MSCYSYSERANCLTGLVFDSLCAPEAPTEDRGESLQNEMYRIVDILESAEQVVNSVFEEEDLPTPFAMLEPTPLGPNGVQHVVISSSSRPHPSTSHRGNISTSKKKNIVESDLEPFLIDYDESNTTKLRLGEGFRPTLCANQTDFHLTYQPVVDHQEMSTVSSTVSANGFKHKETVSPSPSSSCHDVQHIQAPGTSVTRFRQYQSDQWNERFQGLVHFKERYGHCIVPNCYPDNQQLAQWVKRQRYQYKLKRMGRHSTLTDARRAELEAMSFVWDSHKAVWQERFQALEEFHCKYGHSRIPTSHPDKALLIWVKCQRRAMKIFLNGNGPVILPQRVADLNRLDFDWNPGISRSTIKYH